MKLDANIKEQLATVFAQLEGTVALVADHCYHKDQAELLEMLEEVESTNPAKIKTELSSQESQTPRFHIRVNGRPNGIQFRGLPGGHEFTSLILAILNSDQKGKLPDPAIAHRIRNLKGPVRIRTYISLTCENCPDVVQALNQMATLHEDFEHEMVDGAYAQTEIDALGIQGVPSIVVNDKMIHSGRISFIDLLQKMEETFGVASSSAPSSLNLDLGHFDVVVVGGGPAGASSAIYSVRKGLKTALIAERIGGQVQDTKGIENLIGVTYTEGPQLSGKLFEHIRSYPVQLLEQRRVAKVERKEKVEIEIQGGERLTTDALIIATGAKWRELGVPGEKEYLGRGVAFCPHCDGPYYKGKKISVIGGGNSGVEAAIDLAGIVREVVVIEYNDQLKADKVLVDKLLSLPNCKVITNARTKEIVGDGQKVYAMDYVDRATEETKRLELDGVFVQIGLLPNSGFLKGVVELTKFGEIVVDGKGRSSVPGIYAAGDVTTTPYKQIVIAMGEGAKAALAAFEDRMYQGAGAGAHKESAKVGA
jgi:NADH-dependent peroxiredoxin subunit F